MNYHMLLTRRCNLNCIYCHGGETTGPDSEIEYSFDELMQVRRVLREEQSVLTS